MKIYNINSNYVNYLREFEPIILRIDGNKEKRPFVGVVLNINNNKYYAPLTHVQKNRNRLTDFNLYDKNGSALGCIKINNMIPVKKDSLLIEIDTKMKKNDSIQNIKYKKMLKRQLEYIEKNIDKFNKKVNKIYKIGTSKIKYSFINNFPLLEEKCKLYIPEFYIYQNKEKGKLEIFTEEQDNDKYKLYKIVEVPNELTGKAIDLKQLSDATTFALKDEKGANISFYSIKTNKVYKDINKLNEEVNTLSQ